MRVSRAGGRIAVGVVVGTVGIIVRIDGGVIVGIVGDIVESIGIDDGIIIGIVGCNAGIIIIGSGIYRQFLIDRIRRIGVIIGRIIGRIIVIIGNIGGVVFAGRMSGGSILFCISTPLFFSSFIILLHLFSPFVLLFVFLHFLLSLKCDVFKSL